MGLTLTWTALMNIAAVVQAQEQLAVTRVEEDWELVVGQPDADSTAPQVTCVTSPLGDLSGLHASVELNHQTQPDFGSGGVNLQLWNGEDSAGTRESVPRGLLNYANETVRWTQAMSLTEYGLRFSVNGDSTTWGHFGGDGTLKATLSTSLSNLNAYRPSVSVAKSGVGFASNRVTRLVLKEVRYYSSQNLLARDTTERVVYPK
jgi:hypothetical protein